MEHEQYHRLLEACRTGNFSVVYNIIKTLRSDQICLPGVGGTTPLHIAVANSYSDIVSLLIKRCCARTFKNKNNKTAFEEASSSDIKTMLLRPVQSHSRFTQQPVFFSAPAFGIWRYIVNGFRLVECGYYEKKGVEERRSYTLSWLEENLKNNDERDLIVSYFKCAFIEDSTKPILMALTEETSFYTLLNKALIKEPENKVFKADELHGPLLISRNLFKAVYDGQHGDNYDGLPLFAKVIMTRSEVSWLKDKINKPPLSLKIFWSVTKSREIASTRNGNVLFTLTCKESTTKRTLCLDGLSGYPDEEEVLVAPMTKMKIVDVRRARHGEYEIDILYWDW